MLVETDNLVSAEEFRNHLDKYLSAARRGSGPVAVTRGSEVVGFFVSREEYESLFGQAVKKLLSSRSKGPTVSHKEVRAQVGEVIERRARKT